MCLQPQGPNARMNSMLLERDTTHLPLSEQQSQNVQDMRNSSVDKHLLTIGLP